MREEDELKDSDSSLRKTVEFLSSLISLSHSTKVFAAKWQSIRARLEGLATSLASLETCDSAVAEVVLSLMTTVAECYDLARRCVDLSYSGKLLMQSDLDVIAARFDEHSRRLAEIYDAGVLTRGSALVVSRPSFGACRDDMRFYVRDLVTRMKVGDSEMKSRALASLHSAVVEEEKYVGVIAELGDIVAVIVNFLDSPEDEIREGSARLVSEILGFEAYKSVLIAAGVIAPLVRVLECGSEPARELSAKCLMKVTENSDNAWSVSAHGGATALLKICSDESSGARLIAPACGVLRNLAGVEEIRRFMVEEGAVPALARLARAKDEAAQINSIELLRSLASADEATRQAVVREGGARALLRVVEPRSACSPKARAVALRAIESACFSPAGGDNNNAAILLNNSFTEHLVYFVRGGGEVSVQELALKVAAKLAGASEEAKRVLGEAGLMPELARLIDSKSFSVREVACEALLGMVGVPKNRKRFAQDERSIGLILQQLDPDRETTPANKRLLLSILMSLTATNSGRRKIAANGNLRNVEKLADADVSDAKKLVRKLSTSRFRNLIAGILWH